MSEAIPRRTELRRLPTIQGDNPYFLALGREQVQRVVASALHEVPMLGSNDIALVLPGSDHACNAAASHVSSRACLDIDRVDGVRSRPGLRLKVQRRGIRRELQVREPEEIVLRLLTGLAAQQDTFLRAQVRALDDPLLRAANVFDVV